MKLIRASEEWEKIYGVCYVHQCLGCGHKHHINVEKPNHLGAKWSFNNNMDRPTFSPSINIIGKCHYFIQDGMIKYCSDSKHALAGQTVELPDLDGW